MVGVEHDVAVAVGVQHVRDDAARPLTCARGSSSTASPAGGSGSPTVASDAPGARCAATGAKMSRP